MAGKETMGQSTPCNSSAEEEGARGCNQQESGRLQASEPTPHRPGGWLRLVLPRPLPVVLGKLLTLALCCPYVKI